MNEVADCAEQILRSSPHPALRLSELHPMVAELVDRGLTLPRLRAILEGDTNRFRILDSSNGPWRVAAPHAEPGSHVWVVGLSDPEPVPGHRRAVFRLRENVRWLARGIDERSPVDVSRWYAIALSERAARAALARRAA
jgi:hypothetical protein